MEFNKWNCIIGDPFCLAYFTWLVFKVYPCFNPLFFLIAE